MILRPPGACHTGPYNRAMSEAAVQPGTLYVVATPIGNREDLTPRARRVLETVDRIAAEDTRHSRGLLDPLGIRTPLVALHEHNEREAAPALIEALAGGQSVALISDAGTPLLSDPGYWLVRAARAAGIPVVPVPGASALLAALAVAGLPTDRFAFEGFLPAKAAARRSRLEALAREPRTLVFYEAPHRVAETLRDLAEVFGADRPAVLARELTKKFETVRDGTLAELAGWVASDADQQRGEIVLVVGGAEEDVAASDAEAERVLRVLLDEMPSSRAAAVAARITGQRKNLMYERALALQGETEKQVR